MFVKFLLQMSSSRKSSQTFMHNQYKHNFETLKLWNLQAKYNIIKEVLGSFHGRLAQPTEEESNILTALRDIRQNARLAMKAQFNANFGSTFLTDTGKESAFSYNVQRYADVYTSRLENFMAFSSDAWLYTPFDVKILPHHIKVGPNSLQTRSIPMLV